MKELTKNIITEDGEKEFQFRFLNNDGVGLLTTQNDTSYLILDSINYWYDLIQNEYPKKKKCNCKNEWFNISFNYLFREDTDDIKEIKITTTCTSCNKISKPISIDIDYSPTHQLIEKPITFCEKPKIKYKFSDLTSYWSGNDLKSFLEFIFLDLKLNVYCWFYKKSDENRHFEKVTFEKAIEIITVNHRYLNFYFSSEELNLNTYINYNISSDTDICIKNDIWRKDEIIQLSSPIHMTGYGLLYYITYCNQYIHKGNVIDKSHSFEKTCAQVKSWLKQNFITKRGTNCFDGKDAYEKYITQSNSQY